MRRIEYGIRKFWNNGATPFIAKLYGQSTAESLDKPLSTISCSGTHHMLITPFVSTTKKQRNCDVELGFRMLQPNELAAATGFPEDYKFTGTKADVVKQIGNAVPPNFARALFGQALKEMVA